MARTRQPQGAARIDWSNPLARLLALAYVGGQRIDVVKQRTATFDANVSVEPVSYGLATRTPVSNGVSFGTGPVITGSSGAVVCLANPTSSVTNYSSAFSQRSTSPNRQFGLLFNSSVVYASAGSLEAYMFDGAAVPFRTSISNTVIDGKWHSYGANFNGGYFSLFVDGAILDSSSSSEQSVGSCVDASQIVTTGTLAGSSINGADYKTAFLGVWNRLLSTDEYRSLSENPWQIFAPPRRLWIQLGGAAASSSTYPYTGSGTLVYAGTPAYRRLIATINSGGVSFTGTPSYNKNTVPVVSGGYTHSGQAVYNRLFSPLATGGITLTGDGVLNVIRAALAAGGFTFAGSAPFVPALGGSVTYSPSVGGTLTFSNTAEFSILRSVLASGGLVYSGSAGLAILKAIIAAGGLTFSGVASVSGPSSGTGTLDQATIDAIATAVWQRIIESGLSAEQLIRLLVSHAAGSATGLENGSPVFKSLDGSKDRITGTYSAGTRNVTGRDAT